MRILVIAEHDNAALKDATLNTVTAARHIGGKIELLVAGHECAAVAGTAARLAGVERVLLADAPHLGTQLSEEIAATVLMQAEAYSHVLAPASSFGKSLLPRVAALLDVAQVSDVIAIESPDTFVRPVYAGSALATVRSSDRIKLLTVRSTAFAATGNDADPAPIQTAAVTEPIGTSRLAARELTLTGRPQLDIAGIVVSGGRGLGSSENYHALLAPLADQLGAALGASRAAVDAGYAPNDSQVGQTGKIVAPRLYFAIGVSGAIQHVAGMKDSKFIVAINKDPDAPIFEIADYGLVGDLFELVPELTAGLQAVAN